MRLSNSNTMPAQMQVISHRSATIGRLSAHGPGGETLYQVDATRDGYRVVGLQEGITAVGSLTEARRLMRQDYRRRA